MLSGHVKWTSWTIDEVKLEFSIRGHQYIGPHTMEGRVPYTCRCGLAASIAMKQLFTGADGCKPCIQKKKEATARKQSALQKPDTVSTILSQHVKCTTWTLDEVKHEFFARGLTFIGPYVGWKRKIPYTCACGYTTSSVLEKILDGHGGCKPCQRKKATENMMTRYGVPHVSQVPAVKAKWRNTLTARYGVDHPSHVPEFKAKAVAAMQATWIANHDNQVAKTRATCMERFGAPHQMQNATVFKRSQSSLYRTKTHTFPSGRKITYQGYEFHAIHCLLTDPLITEDEILSGHDKLKHLSIPYTWNDKQRMYYPDIYLPSLNLMIEVKSTYTWNMSAEQNRQKLLATKAQGYECEVWIINTKGKVEEVIEF